MPNGLLFIPISRNRRRGSEGERFQRSQACDVDVLTDGATATPVTLTSGGRRGGRRTRETGTQGFGTLPLNVSTMGAHQRGADAWG